MNRVIKQLRQARLSQGFSQAQLCERVKFPQSHLSKIESGKSDPRLSSVVEVGRSLDLELVFVPRVLVPAVESLVRGESSDMKPAWLPDEDEV